jgi:hypothetical protein
VVQAPRAPEHTYRVCFPDGAEDSLHRADLMIFRQNQAAIPGEMDSAGLRQFV